MSWPHHFFVMRCVQAITFVAQEQQLVTMKMTDTSHQTINEKGSGLSSLQPQLSEAVKAQ